jgi:hypothetical protein
MAVKAGAWIPMANALDAIVCIRIDQIAEDHLAERGVRGVDLMEMFLHPEDERDWHALTREADEPFDEDACERNQAGIAWLQPSPEILDEQVERLLQRSRK